jgi:hypothetical protein
MAIGTAVMAVPLMLGLGLAVDAGNQNRVRGNLQAALDAAAMQIAVNLNSGRTDEQLQALGSDFLKANIDADHVDSGSVPSLKYLGVITDGSGVQHLRANADYSYSYLIPRSFGSQSGTSSSTIYVRTEISARMGDDACVYALNHTAPRAVEAGGNTSVTMDGCVIASNSSADDSIYVAGSATLAADCLQSSGGIDATGGLTTKCAQNRTHAWRALDPFANLIEPVPPMPLSNPKKADTVVQPGRYTDLTLDGTKTLQPGLYYIVGSLSIKGTVSGTGVTFFMADGGVTANGSASLSISAPTSGSTAGMLFWSSKTNTSANSFNGNGATDLNGYLYFPKSQLTYNGNNTTTSTCMRIVADTIKMTGSSKLNSDCSAALGGRQAKVSGPLYYSG